ncbi:serine/threonine protein kinase [Streptomyces sp. SID11385]|uniref:serine/threonine protein kinase n=1 Tax=Streptomyces sp. SID11385 TaxID=2706031 RepID=UPI0013CA939E|nr:serine/threonine protein kinase [Streptomyces sp. SID11385]NEA39161.1 serine/threonine protein kinase [Streptomyces sp. SID11385]
MPSATSLTATVLGACALLTFTPRAHADGAPVRDPVTVRAQGSTVRLTTSACPRGGTATLVPEGRGAADAGYAVDLAPGGRTRTASWLAVDDGRYVARVRCADGTRLSGAAVRVPGPLPSPTVTPEPEGTGTGTGAKDAPVPRPSGSATASASPADPYADAGMAESPAGVPGEMPKGGVRGGLGGSAKAERDSPGAFDAGIALVAAGGVGALVWWLRRRVWGR